MTTIREQIDINDTEKSKSLHPTFESYRVLKVKEVNMSVKVSRELLHHGNRGSNIIRDGDLYWGSKRGLLNKKGKLQISLR